MNLLWLYLVACATTASVLAPVHCEQPASENNLAAVVGQLSRCHGSVDDLMVDLAEYLMSLCENTINTIDLDRDRTLSSVKDKYVHTDIADEDISTVVVQASQMAQQFGERKRDLAFACVVQVRQAVLDALDKVDRLCEPGGDRASRAVLENVRNHVLRHEALAIEWIRDYTETNIGVTSKGVLELGKVALQLNDRVLTTEAYRHNNLQQELADEVDVTIERIVTIFKVNDDKIYAAIREFSEYFRDAEVPRQAVEYYLSDSKTGIVKTKI